MLTYCTVNPATRLCSLNFSLTSFFQAPVGESWVGQPQRPLELLDYGKHIEEGFIQKRRQRSSLLFGGQNRFHSLPRKLFYTRKILRKGWINPILHVVSVQYILFFKSSWCKIASTARNFVFILLLWRWVIISAFYRTWTCLSRSAELTCHAAQLNMDLSEQICWTDLSCG